nr:ATP-binding cassette domain-containing protein [Streptomyces sp. ODS25]
MQGAPVARDSTPMVRVRNLVKEFRRPKRHAGPFGGLRTLVTRQYTVARAVDDVSFDVAEGELVGYLGPNGAGKSTTIKMLTGILVPTGGEVEVGGLVPWRDREANSRQIGVVFGQRSQLWWDLPLRESLRLVGVLYDIPPRDYDRVLGEFTEILEMDDFLDTPVRQLSLGQRMRGDLAAAMLYRPRVLYLDEPTIGLDVVAKERIRHLVERLNREYRTTIILTTHDLDDVERLCRRIVLIDHGRVLYDGDVQTLKKRYAPYRQLVFRLAEADHADDAPDDWVDLIGAELVPAGRGELHLRFDPAVVSAADLIAAVMKRHRMSDLSIVEPALEPVIRQIYAQRALS